MGTDLFTNYKRTRINFENPSNHKYEFIGTYMVYIIPRKLETWTKSCGKSPKRILHNNKKKCVLIYLKTLNVLEWILKTHQTKNINSQNPFGCSVLNPFH